MSVAVRFARWAGILPILVGVACGGAAPSGPRTAAQEREHLRIGGVAFDTVDEATVRIFAILDVGAQRTRVGVLPTGGFGHGSGVVVSSRGLVLTAAHVVKGARALFVRLPGENGEIFPASVVYGDHENDFAILAVAHNFERYVQLDDEPVTLHVRDTIDAIGYPADASRNDPQSTRGIISGIRPDGQLQMSALLNAGNSGGPILRGDHLIGLAIAVIRTERFDGLSYGVPLSKIQPIVDQVLADGAFEAARSSLQRDLGARASVAVGVDQLVQAGGHHLGAFVAEAEEWVRAGGNTPRLDRLSDLAESVVDAQFRQLAASFLLQAYVVAIMRSGACAGGTCDIDRLDPSRREFVVRLVVSVNRILSSAIQLDPQLTERSRFAAWFLQSQVVDRHTTLASIDESMRRAVRALDQRARQRKR